MPEHEIIIKPELRNESYISAVGREEISLEIFEKLKKGEPVDMMSEEYRPAIIELQRADIALFRVNHSEPGSEERTAMY